MPELPDITVYVEGLRSRILGQPLERVRLVSPFLLRSVDPPIDEVDGGSVRDIRRLGKRIVLGMDDDLFLVLHLMIAGRLQWKPRGARPAGKTGLAAIHRRAGVRAPGPADLMSWGFHPDCEWRRIVRRYRNSR